MFRLLLEIVESADGVMECEKYPSSGGVFTCDTWDAAVNEVMGVVSFNSPAGFVADFIIDPAPVKGGCATISVTNSPFNVWTFIFINQ